MHLLVKCLVIGSMPMNKKKGIKCREAQQGVSKFLPDDAVYTQVVVDR